MIRTTIQFSFVTPKAFSSSNLTLLNGVVRDELENQLSEVLHGSMIEVDRREMSIVEGHDTNGWPKEENE